MLESHFFLPVEIPALPDDLTNAQEGKHSETIQRLVEEPFLLVVVGTKPHVHALFQTLPVCQCFPFPLPPVFFPASVHNFTFKHIRELLCNLLPDRTTR